MKRLSKTCYVSDDNHLACALTTDGKYAIVKNDPNGIQLIKIFNSFFDAKEFIIDYEMAIKEFEEVFK
jgi:hypothetical protein